MAELKGSKTEQNLMTAFAGESQAHTKYLYYASKAIKDGYIQIGKLFEETAKNEKEHAKIWFKFLHGGEVPGTVANLEDAAARELEEETGLKGVKGVQLGSYGDYDRDPRTRIITTAYVFVEEEGKLTAAAGDDAADAAWCDVRLELKQTERTQEREQDLYVLHIENADRELDTTAVVKRTMTCGLIREEKFSVEEMGMLAADHAAIIVQALVLLKNRL